MNTYYKTCPHCGSNLDPGEKCDCTTMSGLKHIGTYTDPTGEYGTLPLYQMEGSINTKEGWSRLVAESKARRKEIPCTEKDLPSTVIVRKT